MDPANAGEEALTAWNTAPLMGSMRLIVDLPALLINVLITYLVYRGIKESRNFSNVMVILKLAVVVLVILVGGALIFSYDLFANWTPPDESGTRSFMPNGFGGVMAAVSGVFFAYIGFDAVSVLAEESKNPQRDLPRGMILSLVICTVVYILLTLVLTGAVVYSKFAGVGDPLAFIFEEGNLDIPWMQVLVAICAVIAMSSVMLVFQMGQPRIWMSMSRDGLLPPAFQKIHPKYKTPSFSTIVTGLLVGVPILFTDKDFVLDFTSIGTLFAFVLVCGGVLLLPPKEKQPGKFHMPHIDGRFIFPALVIIAIALIYYFNPSYHEQITSMHLTEQEAAAAVEGLDSPDQVQRTLDDALLAKRTLNISTIIFWIITILLAVATYFKRWSLIPLLGLTSCLYLLTGMAASNWKWFFVWFGIGLVIYFLYGYKKSRLSTTT